MAVPEETVWRVVGKQMSKPYNLCDGTRSLTQVAKAAGKHHANLSRTVRRWIEAGIVFRLGNGKGAALLHAYPIAPVKAKARPKKRSAGAKRR